MAAGGWFVMTATDVLGALLFVAFVAFLVVSSALLVARRELRKRRGEPGPSLDELLERWERQS